MRALVDATSAPLAARRKGCSAGTIQMRARRRCRRRCGSHTAVRPEMSRSASQDCPRYSASVSPGPHRPVLGEKTVYR